MWYRNPKLPPLDAPVSPGLFIGWELESGLRYRGVLKVMDYESCRTHGWSPGFVVSVPEKECYFPEEICFPFAV